MDSSLNLAHRCARKAEYYVNERRYQEAIDCHLRAAHHLSEALNTTTCDKVKASLDTQKWFHLTQENVLKQKQLCENQRLIDYRQQLQRQRQLRDLHCQQKTNQSPMQAQSGPAQGSGADSSHPEHVMSEIMDIFSEHDSLLQFLIDRRAPTQSSSPSSPTDSTTNVVTSTDSLYKNGSRRPKDDKTVIEELQTVNEKLRQLVFQLYSELEDSNKENRRLQAENQSLREENRNAISSTVPELPPLEPPELLY